MTLARVPRFLLRWFIGGKIPYRVVEHTKRGGHRKYTVEKWQLIIRGYGWCVIHTTSDREQAITMAETYVGQLTARREVIWPTND